MALADPTNVLVVHFGQLGDVVLGLPALDAIRHRYPGARLTALTGTPAHEIVKLSGLADAVEGVDRRAMKYGSKARAVANILRLVRRVRRARYDAVVDLHAFYETGLLARLSGARLRVGPNRENRSLPFAYTHQAPPEDRSEHAIERYLAVAAAADAPSRVREPHIVPNATDAETASQLLESAGLVGSTIAGLNPGAGWEIRRWPRERFVELGRRLVAYGTRVVVFAGPEEAGLGAATAAEIGPGAAALERLSLGQLAAVMARCSIVVSNDTGPSHISAGVGVPTLVLMPGNAGPSPFSVRGERHRLVAGDTIATITLEDVLTTAREMLARSTSVGR